MKFKISDLQCPYQDLFTDKRIPKGVEQQLQVVNKYDYLDDFDMEAREDVLMIGNISLEEIKVGS